MGFFFFPLSLAIPQFGLLSHISSLRLSLGYSGLVLSLSMEPEPPCPAPACWWQSQASGLHPCWELGLGAYSVGFFSSWLYCLLRFQNSSPTCQWEVSCFLETSMTPSPGRVSIPNSSFVSLSFFFFFGRLYFVLPPFEENRLPFWVPGVLCQHSEVVLWKLLSIQMIFWWICGEESGLSTLFLQHLGTAPKFAAFT